MRRLARCVAVPLLPFFPAHTHAHGRGFTPGTPGSSYTAAENAGRPHSHRTGAIYERLAHQERTHSAVLQLPTVPVGITVRTFGVDLVLAPTL